MVRVFRSEHDVAARDASLRGVVDEIGTGTRTAFGDAAQLLRILCEAAPASSEPATRAEPDAARPDTYT